MSDPISLFAWAHWKLLEKDPDPGAQRMALDAKVLFERLKAAEKVVAVVRDMWRGCPNKNPEPCGRCDLCELDEAMEAYDKLRGEK